MISLVECLVCKSYNIKPSFIGHTNRNPADGKTWAVDCCESCQHSFMNPLPEWEDLEPFYSDEYEVYVPDHGSGQDGDQAVIAQAKIDNEFRHLPLPSGKKVLDVGCGGGFFIRICQKLGATVQGVEPSEAGYKNVKDQGLPVFHGMLNDFVKANNNTKKFDVITANHVLEHAPNPVEVLSDMSSLLAENGIIWIAVPNAQSHFAKKLGELWHSTDLPYHIQQFSPNSLALAGDLAGLKVSRSYTFSHPPASIASYRKYLRRKYFLIERVVMKLKFVDYYAAKLAKKIDSDPVGLGEAIIIEFIKK